jgi:hypothetical protein
MSDSVWERKMLPQRGSRKISRDWFRDDMVWVGDTGDDERLLEGDVSARDDPLFEKITHRVDFSQAPRYSILLLVAFVGSVLVIVGAIIGLIVSPLYGSQDIIVLLFGAAAVGAGALAFVLKRAEIANKP